MTCLSATPCCPPLLETRCSPFTRRGSFRLDFLCEALPLPFKRLRRPLNKPIEGSGKELSLPRLQALSNACYLQVSGEALLFNIPFLLSLDLLLYNFFSISCPSPPLGRPGSLSDLPLCDDRRLSSSFISNKASDVALFSHAPLLTSHLPLNFSSTHQGLLSFL